MLKRRADSFSRPDVRRSRVLTKASGFGQRVFVVVRKIPRGKTMTYAQVARAAGSPHAYRAVGNILSQNYDPKIPCHRVVRADGKMGGYNRGGISAKAKILAKEKA